MAIANDTPDEEPLPIVIAGGGCVGLFLALLLAHTPIPNRIIVIEPQDPDPASTRAMAHQPPTYPILAQVPGLLPELIQAGSLSSGLCFRTSVRNGSRVIASKEFNNSGAGTKGKGQLLLPQGKFQKVLLERLLKLGNKTDVRLGWSVSSFSQSQSSFPSSSFAFVSVHLQSPSHQTSSIAAAYLIGADGAHSLVRNSLGVDLGGETLDAQLVALDIRFPFRTHGFLDANFIIDTKDYGLIGRIDNEGLWRVSYGVPAGMSKEEIEGGVVMKLRNMLPNGGKNEQGEDLFEVVRIAPYRAQQRCAERLVKGRVLLVGDAAHCEYSVHLFSFPSYFCLLSGKILMQYSNEPLCWPGPRIRDRGCGLSRTYPGSHSHWEGFRSRWSSCFLVRGPTAEIFRCGGQTESYGICAGEE